MPTEATPSLQDALRLLLQDDDGGFAVYDALWRRKEVWEAVPLALHILMLRHAKKIAAADRLERWGLAKGVDLSMAPVKPNAPIDRRIDEYRSLFSRGLLNSRMLANYACLLSEVGDGDALADLMAPDRRVRIVTISETSPDDGVPLHQAVHRVLSDHEAQAEWQESVQSVRNMFFLRDALGIDEPCIHQLKDIVHREVSLSLPLLTDYHPVHQITNLPPKDYSLSSWAVYSNGTGYNEKHIHHRAILTAVYYVALEADGDLDAECGALRLCPDKEGQPDCPGWPDMTIPIRPGMLVIAPSYYTHYTRPAGRRLRRVALPIDVSISYDS